MRTAYRRRTCRLCGDFRQDHLRRQITDIGNRIGRVPAKSRQSGGPFSVPIAVIVVRARTDPAETECNRLI